MKPSVCTPLARMCTAIASAMSESFCGVLNTQRVFGSVGAMMSAEAAIEIIGTSASATTSRIASELGVTVEPMMTSTLSSLISLRVFFTASVVSDLSSRMMKLTFWPPMTRRADHLEGIFLRNAERGGRPGRRQRDADGDVRMGGPGHGAGRALPPAAGMGASHPSSDCAFQACRERRRGGSFFQSIANLAQQQHVLRRRTAAAALGASRLICFTIRKMMKARMTKLSATVRKLP